MKFVFYCLKMQMLFFMIAESGVGFGTHCEGGGRIRMAGDDKEDASSPRKTGMA
jgi:hypothetical protein